MCVIRSWLILCFKRHTSLRNGSCDEGGLPGEEAPSHDLGRSGFPFQPLVCDLPSLPGPSAPHLFPVT